MHWTFGIRIVQLLFAFLGTVIRFGGEPQHLYISTVRANSLLCSALFECRRHSRIFCWI
jgi:hypothetical protein